MLRCWIGGCSFPNMQWLRICPAGDEFSIFSRALALHRRPQKFHDAQKKKRAGSGQSSSRRSNLARSRTGTNMAHGPVQTPPRPLGRCKRPRPPHRPKSATASFARSRCTPSWYQWIDSIPGQHGPTISRVRKNAVGRAPIFDSSGS